MKHCIIAKFKEEITKEQKEAMLPEILALFEHTTEIPGIHGVELLKNCVDRENRYDLVIRIDMEREALEAYDGCVWHHEWKDNYGAMLAKKAIFDYE